MDILQLQNIGEEKRQQQYKQQQQLQQPRHRTLEFE